MGENKKGRQRQTDDLSKKIAREECSQGWAQII